MMEISKFVQMNNSLERSKIVVVSKTAYKAYLGYIIVKKDQV